MRAKARNTESMPSSVGAIRRFYLYNKLYDSLLREAYERDVSVSQLIREKLEVIDQICFLVRKLMRADFQK